MKQEVSKHKVGIFFSGLIVAIGGIIYEIILGTAASYLLGNGVLHFSLTIGLFLTGMGFGSLFAHILQREPERNFVIVESILGIIGGFSVFILFVTYAYTNLFYVVFVLLILAIGILIGTEIPVLLALLRESSSKKLLTLTSRILSLDYFGALFASLAFPLFLLPQLGVLRASFLIGFLNLFIALLILVSFWQQVRRKIPLISIIVAGFILLAVFFVTATPITGFINKGLYQDEVIFETQSRYQTIVFTQFKDDLRMYLNGNIQFSSIDEHRYHEPLVHVPFAHSVREPERVLVLGGGDGLAVRELLLYESVTQIDLVDLDPEVTRLAQEFLPLRNINNDSLSNSKVTVQHTDAFTYLENSSILYDLIIIDLPDPNDESLAKLYSQEFYALVKRSLSETGVMVTQAISPYFTNQSYWTIEYTIAQEFSYTYPYNVQVPSFGPWGFVMASRDPLSLDSAQLPGETSFIQTAEDIESLFYFDADLVEPTTHEVSTLFDPQVLFLYEEESRQWQ